MAKVCWRFFAGDRQKPANLLRRERAGTPRTRLVRQQSADRFTQGFGLGFQLLQVQAALQPAPPPQAYSVFAQTHLHGNGFARVPLAGRQDDFGTLHQAMWDFSTGNDGLKQFALFGG
jgi:hypothetical protein